MTSASVGSDLSRLFEDVARGAREAGVFREVETRDDGVHCAAKEQEAATYRLRLEDGKLWVSLALDDRWVSQSIEAELVHSGDKLEDLIDEELVASGCDKGPLPFEHFRDEEKVFVFRSPIPVEVGDVYAGQTALSCLLAYEAAFRELGDMSGSDDED